MTRQNPQSHSLLFLTMQRYRSFLRVFCTLLLLLTLTQAQVMYRKHYDSKIMSDVYLPVEDLKATKRSTTTKLAIELLAKRTVEFLKDFFPSKITKSNTLDFDEVVPNILYLGRYPRKRRFIQQLREKDITNVINLLMPKEYGSLPKYLSRAKVTELRLSTHDHIEPSVGYLLAGFEFIYRKAIMNCEKVYVHCYKGVGRSAAVAFLYLAYTMQQESALAVEKYPNEEAFLAHVQIRLSSIRPEVRPALYTQENILAAWKIIQETDFIQNIVEAKVDEIEL